MKKVLVVLSGGGMKGLAHIGALRVIRRLDLPVVAWAGTSVGSLIGSMAAAGMTVAEIENVGLSVNKRTILDLDWRGFFTRRLRVPGVNRGKRLREFIDRSLPAKTFDELATPAYVNAVDVASGTNVVFGLPGLRDVSLVDAVLASCSIPGVYPPVRIRDRYFIDGAVIDNLQLRLTRVLRDVDFIVAINLRGHTPVPNESITGLGFIDVINRGNDLTGEFLTESNLASQLDVPCIFVHPDVASHHYLDFDNTGRLIDAGEAATEAAFDRWHRSSKPTETGIFAWLWGGSKSRRVANPFTIDQSRCVRCGLCIVNNQDGLFRQDKPGGPVTVNRTKASTHDLAPIKECPFGAIRLDRKLLGEMYDDPPDFLLKVADDPTTFSGEPAFAPPVTPMPAVDEPPATPVPPDDGGLPDPGSPGASSTQEMPVVSVPPPGVSGELPTRVTGGDDDDSPTSFDDGKRDSSSRRRRFAFWSSRRKRAVPPSESDANDDRSTNGSPPDEAADNDDAPADGPPARQAD